MLQNTLKEKAENTLKQLVRELTSLIQASTIMLGVIPGRRPKVDMFLKVDIIPYCLQKNLPIFREDFFLAFSSLPPGPSSSFSQ